MFHFSFGESAKGIERVADTGIYTGLCFERKLARAKIECTACGYTIIIPARYVLEVLPALALRNDLPKRLKCHFCGAKRARLTPIHPTGRG